jgi:hypothetical protein
LKSYSLSRGYGRKQHAQAELSFVQISDRHSTSPRIPT